jgi:hypothetical protein
MHIGLTFDSVSVPQFRFQVSAQPPAKKTADQIEKETFTMKFHISAAAGRERPVAIMVGAAHPTFLQVVLRAP